MRASAQLLDRRRLRIWLALFFLALAVPALILVREAYGQLKWEAFHQHREQAEELAARIDARLARLVDAEERRSFAEYAFLVVLGEAGANYVQRSPLADFPPRDPIPGLIGHFQIDAEGRFSTPLLPSEPDRGEEFGISGAERAQRAAQERRIVTILAENRLVRPGDPGRAQERLAGLASPEPAVETDNASALRAEDGVVRAPARALAEGVGPASPGVASAPAADEVPDASARQQLAAQSAFDQLSLQAERARKLEAREAMEDVAVEEIELESSYEPDPAATVRRLLEPGGIERRRARKEYGVALAPASPPAGRLDAPAEAKASGLATRPRILTFETELDPFDFSELDSGHLVLFRKVWREGKRYIQGLLIDREPFLEALIEQPFRTTALARMSNLLVASGRGVVATFDGGGAGRSLASTTELGGAVLYRAALAAPLASLALEFRVNRLPAGPGAKVVFWAGASLAVVLCGGFWLAYRLGLRQIALARQQQDFVSAISHELKTPLTSIRMYGELLREGWASEERRRTYYEYIVEESERLSRLIANVLQLARLTRSEVKPDLKPVLVETLMDGMRSKIATQIERAGFELALECAPDAGATPVLVDTDLVSQIVINLVDNALKFSAQAERKTVVLSCRVLGDGFVELAVRDHGPGVAKDQMRKIFALFYRTENELTRETVGTGIGLSLVHQLVQSMGGRVDVVNASPGAEFRVCLPVAPSQPGG